MKIKIAAKLLFRQRRIHYARFQPNQNNPRNLSHPNLNFALLYFIKTSTKTPFRLPRNFPKFFFLPFVSPLKYSLLAWETLKKWLNDIKRQHDSTAAVKRWQNDAIQPAWKHNKRVQIENVVGVKNRENIFHRRFFPRFSSFFFPFLLYFIDVCQLFFFRSRLAVI